MRIVSLCPSVTDTVFALGKGDELVGRTKFCVQPHGRVEVVERVGGTKNPHVDRIVELTPDVVLMNEEENRREDAEALVARGLRIVSTFVRDVAGAAAGVVAIGAAVGADEQARALARGIERAAERVAQLAPARTPFVYLIWQNPWMAVGSDTYISSLLGLAGGDNVVVGSDRYPEIGAESLARAERIFLSSEPFPFAESHRCRMAADTGLSLERFQLVDGELLSWHGSKTVEGLAYARSLFDRVALR